MGEDNAVIRCICGFTEDDGFTIQCEGCNAWEHGLCFGYQDEASVPDTYFCELCMPRKVDADRARALQAPRIAYTRLVRPQESTEQGKKSRPKTKRQRTERASASERAAAAEDTSNGGNGSSAPTPAEDTSMAPPNNKPKRKAGPSHKPRNASRALNDLKEEDDFFRVVPWEMEYTPIKDNIIRGAPARHAMTQLYREWIDVDENSPPRKGRASYHDSGLPSPTETGALRLSPDMFTSPDFSTLGPPVPPVTLSGTDLSSLSAPTSIRPVDDNHCFLPLKYIEPSSGIYARPTLYGVFVNEAVNAGGFLGEFRGEIIDSASYRKDPINQYSALGIPKPYVHSVGPPVNLMLDARSYGCDNRFVRSGCHPNAVVRPLLFRSTEDQDQKPKLRFGIFASRDLSKNEEIVLGWEWDDQHVVHTLRAVIDSTLKSGASKPPIAPETMDRLALKFDSILTNIFGTFQSCACTVTTDCAFSQMRRLVSGQTFHGVSGSRARKRIDLGELIGAVRGWRRRELEAAEAAKARRFASSGEWELWRTGPAKSPSDDDEVKHDESTPSRPASTADQSDHGMDVDEPAVGDGEPPAVDEPPSEAVAEPTVAAERDDDETEDELPPPAAASAPEPEPEPKLDEPVEPAATTEAVPSADSADSAPAAPAAADAVEEVAPILEEPATADLAEAAMVTEEPPKTDEEPAKPEEALVTGAEGAEPPKDDAMQVDEVEPTAEPPKPEPEVATEQKDEDETEDEKDGMKTPVPQNTANAIPEQPSSVLSSLPSDQIEHPEPEGEEELSGNESEATTVTVVRSELSDNDSGSEDIHPPTIRRGRRVVSPVAESSMKRSDKKLKSRQKEPAKKVPESVRSTNKRRSRKNIIASSDEGSSEDEAPSSFRRNKSQRSSPSKPPKKSLVRKAPQSDSDLSEAEKENVPKARKADARKPSSSKKQKLDRDSREASKSSVRGPSPRPPKPRSKGKAVADDDELPVKTERRSRKVIPSSPPPDEDEKDSAMDVDTDDIKPPKSKDSTRSKDSGKSKDVIKSKESIKSKDSVKSKDSIKSKDSAKSDDAIKSKDRSKEKAKEATSSKESKAKASKDLEPKTKEAKSMGPSKEPSPAPKETREASPELSPPPRETKEPSPVKELSPPPRESPAPAAKESTPPAKGLTPPPKELDSPIKRPQTPPPESSPAKETAKEDKESTPPPKEPTPPLKEPTPPPPKKVSMKEYLATHKIRKVSHQSDSTDTAGESKTPTDAKEPKNNKESKDAKEAKEQQEEGAAADRSTARLNLLEHLPSARPPSAGSTPTSATTTQSSAYVPRTDYFGNGPNSAGSTTSTPQSNYVPRPSPSYVPRSLPDESPASVGSFTSPSTAYVPRDSFPPDPSVSPVAPRHALPHQTPPRSSHNLPDMPPPLAQRDGPPHYRAPPTGPRAAPTGPRGSWSGSSGGPPHSSGNGPVSPVAPLRGNYPPRGGFSSSRGGFNDRPRGFFGGRGGYRGRGRGM